MADIEHLPSGWTHIGFEEIDSTNAEAMRRAASGERRPLWITARRQTRGRGRSGRSWTSVEGSLAATLLFRPSCALCVLPQLSLVAGVATHAAVTAALPQESRHRCGLKWPNDVLIDGAKVSGILVESAVVGTEPAVAIGIGINAGAAPVFADRLASGLAQFGAATATEKMSNLLASALAHWLAIWSGGDGFEDVRAGWLQRGSSVGDRMTVHAGDVQVMGYFSGLDADGSLLVSDDGGVIRRFTFGDVALGAPRV
ncbi:MAG: biotin--[acetyl-CoA-carboxylase] ligase [Hyphomicrobiaceae bacterium]